MVGLLVVACAAFVVFQAEPVSRESVSPGRTAHSDLARGATAVPIPRPAMSAPVRAPIYVMPSAEHPVDIVAAMTHTGARHFNLAFVLDAGGCVPAWDGDIARLVGQDPTVATMISTVRSRGGDVAVSFGGNGGVELGAGCGSAQRLAAAYQRVIDAHKL